MYEIRYPAQPCKIVSPEGEKGMGPGGGEGGSQIRHRVESGGNIVKHIQQGRARLLRPFSA